MRIQTRTAVVALSLLLALPFIDQPFHVDDPNFLALARHAIPDPLELYRFSINWGGTDEPAFDILANPPLGPWYLMLVSSFAGDREWLYHLAFWPFLAATLVGTSRLADRFALGPKGATWALLFTAVSPALLLASHTVMPDLPLLAFYTLGLALALEGLDHDRPARALAGGLLAGLSGLCRYSGMTAIPLLALYIALHRPRPRPALLALGASILPITIWSGLSLHLYGRVHYITIAGFEGQTLGLEALLHKLGYQVSALGLAIAPAGVLAGLLAGFFAGSKAARAGALTGLITAGIVAWSHPHPLPSILLLCFGFGGGGALAGLGLEAAYAMRKGRLWRGRGGSEADGLFLAAWLFGMLVFNLWLLFASVRYLLPALVPAVLLLQRATLEREKLAPRFAVATAAVLALSLLLSDADRRFAEGYRTYVAALPPPAGQRWFTGHWGLQHYLERQGARPLSAEDRRGPRPGDEVIMPRYAWPQDLPEGLQVREVDRIDLPGPPGLRTFTVEGRACFYADMLAPGPTPVFLPFAFSDSPLETLIHAEVVR